MKNKMKRSGILAGGVSLLLALALMLASSPVLAVPQQPHQFWGSVSICDQQVEEGTVVSARIDGIEYASTIVDGDGQYGFVPTFKVPADDPATPPKEGGVGGLDPDIVEFWVLGQLAGQAPFQIWGSTLLDLVVPQAKLTLNSTVGGSVDVPGEGMSIYDCNTVVDLLAVPDEDCYEFVGWTGDVGTVGNVLWESTTVIMQGDYEITANFAKIQYTLTASASPPEGGSVTGGGTYDCGTQVPVEAIPADECWVFTGWSGDLGGDTNPTSILLDGNKTITANFAQIPYMLTTSASPPEGGSVTGGGTYDCDTVVPVEAIPADECWVFTGWSGDLGGDTNPTTILLDGNKTITANFAKIPYTLTTSASPPEGGSVTGGGVYDCSSQVPVEAIPANGEWYFTNWSGDLGGNTNPTTIHMDGNKNITANFAQFVDACTLTVNSSPPAGGSVTGGGTYECGTQVPVEAIPADECWVFTGWSGDLSGDTNPTSILLDGGKNITAN
ncbi:InlB B-repeat-containing protein, partial [Chloroflexota bacterium]